MTLDYGPIKGIALSYPSDFGDPFYRSLAPFYDELITLIPKGIQIALIVSSDKAGSIARSAHPDQDLRIIVIPGFNEIWLRDLLGFPKKNVVIKPLFRPTYFRGIYTDAYLDILEENIYTILRKLDFEIEHLNLAWDGGNLIHNDSLGFTTDKLLSDNSHLTESKIRRLIENKLEITPVFVPSFKHDQLAHTDGYMNFLKDSTITLSNYPSIPFLNEARKYRDELRKIIESSDMDVVEVWDRPFSEVIKVDKEFLESSRGIFNNFIQLNGQLIIPKFSNNPKHLLSKLHNRNVENLKPYFSRVESINCDHLSKLGGVLHCVSWCW
jgi:agmatine/peptidylarginine deiminase